jgi:chromosome segregation protein
MVYIKKLVMQGFKSFARRTEIPLENAMNVVVGPNGSGKSNITDALCFVLGRMGTKSIRAAKASNLLFSGNKQFKGSNEAVVEIIFDNLDRGMPLDQNEISIKRIVRKNGLSIYKINNETKTRQELIELLAQAGIDPNGFNIVLQGEIAAMIKMSPEERRRIIEEVAGISIYETRKEKSLKELEKTDEKLKETAAILREKTNYLKNLEKDRQDALNYKKMESSINQCKAGIISRDIKDRQREVSDLEKQKSENNSRISILREKVSKVKVDIASCEEKVKEITKKIESSTSGEQEALHREISDLKANLAGQNVRKENYETRLRQNKNKIDSLNLKILETEKEMDLILKKTPEIKKQKELQGEIELKINELEKQRRTYYTLKSEISTLESKREEKQKNIYQYDREFDFIDKTISQVFQELKYSKSQEKAENLRDEVTHNLIGLKSKVQETEVTILDLEKKDAVLEQIIERERKLLQDIVKIEECPLCRNNITEEHRKNVINRAKEKIDSSEKILNENSKLKSNLKNVLSETTKQISLQELKLRDIGFEIMKIKSCDEKKEQIKNIVSLKEDAKGIIYGIDKRLESILKDFEKVKNIEEKYEEARLNLKELSLIDNDLDTQGSSKQRDIERMKVEVKSFERDSEDSKMELDKILEKIADAGAILFKKEKQEQELYERFQKFYNERNEIQDRQKALETNLVGLQHEIRSEDEKNYSIKLREAELNAKLEALDSEFEFFKNVEIAVGSRESLVSKLNILQVKLAQLGSINMRALETYDQVKQICDSIQEKVDIIVREKEKIGQIINEIDKKKKKSFMKTLEAINELFTRNFTQVSRKGEVFLELENKEDPFLGGLDIVVRVGRGKYFDVTSLSGGEKTMVALSLIFAIQEYKPYCFYVFDEIDAALDKHNSELLAGLIKKYMASGQYIIVTHNDALIEAAPVLFGVSMQEGISKLVSQRL